MEYKRFGKRVGNNMGNRFTEDKFATTLQAVVSAPPLCDMEGIPSGDLGRLLHTMQLDAVWHRVVWHCISQHGLEHFIKMLDDDATLSEMFDWHVTEEGWDFWDAMNGMLS